MLDSLVLTGNWEKNIVADAETEKTPSILWTFYSELLAVAFQVQSSHSEPFF